MIEGDSKIPIPQEQDYIGLLKEKLESCQLPQWYTLTVLLYQYKIFKSINLREHSETHHFSCCRLLC